MRTPPHEYLNQATNNTEEYVREQKRSIVQSSIDRNLYHRAGDDACTSGVSMTSSDQRLESENSPDEETKEISHAPDPLIQELNNLPEYVWYAAYDSEMRDEVFNDVLDKWNDNTFPLNKVSIKLENFDLVFATIKELPGMVYLQQRTWGSCFIKLYLINKNQLLDIAKQKSLSFFPDYKDFTMLTPSLIHYKESVIIDHCLPYGYLLRIGEYDNFSIYSLTNSHLQILSDIKNNWEPSDFYIKEFFKAMTESFPNFSSDFLLYYINSKKGLKNKLSSALMSELREFGTFKNM